MIRLGKGYNLLLEIIVFEEILTVGIKQGRGVIF